MLTAGPVPPVVVPPPPTKPPVVVPPVVVPPVVVPTVAVPPVVVPLPPKAPNDVGVAAPPPVPHEARKAIETKIIKKRGRVPPLGQTE